LMRHCYGMLVQKFGRAILRCAPNDNLNALLHPTAFRWGFVAALLLVMIAASWPAPVRALTAEPTAHQAGLVVVHADGTVTSRCIGFNEESISGFELLTRGDFVVRSEITSMGASVCSVDGQGCGEGTDCFCECKSSTCRYWTYWQQLPEGWRYSNAGAATVQVRDGDVQGWVWGDSNPNAASENAPPTLAFTDICNTDAVIYGIAPAHNTGVAATTGVALQPTVGIALVVALPLLLGGAWWLWRGRNAVGHKIERDEVQP
jgi:hypothetical protein